MSKQIFLYKEDASLADADLQALREAGFIPMQVKSFDDVKVVDPLNEADQSAVWLSAMEAISKANNVDSVRTLFGSLLAKKLSNVDIKP